MSNRICSVADCDRPHRAKGFCKKHYYALRPIECSVDGCLGILKAKGLCNVHYRHADDGGTCLYCGEAFSGDRRRVYCSDACRRDAERAKPCGYAGAHRRIRVELGEARLHPCIDCGDDARDWSYCETDPDPLIGDRGSGLGLRYSLDSAHYGPRCAPCHKRFDITHARRST